MPSGISGKVNDSHLSAHRRRREPEESDADARARISNLDMVVFQCDETVFPPFLFVGRTKVSGLSSFRHRRMRSWYAVDKCFPACPRGRQARRMCLYIRIPSPITSYVLIDLERNPVGSLAQRSGEAGGSSTIHFDHGTSYDLLF